MSTEYVKRFENAVANFEAQSNKLKEISNVLRAVVSLVSEVENSKNDLVHINRKAINELHTVQESAVNTIKSVRQIIGNELQQERDALACAKDEVSGLRNQIDDEICKITTYAAHEEEARRTLVKNLTDVLVANCKATVDEIYAPLEKVTVPLEAGNKALSELIRKEEQNSDKYIEAVKQALLLSSSDNIDVVKGLEKSIGYKIDTVVTNIQTVKEASVKEILDDAKYMQATIDKLAKFSEEQEKLLRQIHTDEIVEANSLKDKIVDGVCKIREYQEEAKSSLVENLTDVLAANGKATVDEIYAQFEKVTASLEAENKALSEFIRKEEQNADKYIETLKRTLLLSSSDNIDVVKGLEKSIGYKIDIAETSIKAAQDAAVKEIKANIKCLQSTVNNLTQSSQEQKELLQKISTDNDKMAQKIQNILFASLASAFTAICVIIILLYKAH